jgi:Tetracyclin repressor-like, C-terminal domain
MVVTSDLQNLQARAGQIDTRTLVESLFGLLRAHPRERAAALPLIEARMDERTRRATFRHMLRKRIAAILCTRAPVLPAEDARDMAVVVLQLMKAANSLSDEEGLPGRAAALRELHGLAVRYLEERLRAV